MSIARSVGLTENYCSKREILYGTGKPAWLMNKKFSFVQPFLKDCKVDIIIAGFQRYSNSKKKFRP